MKKTIRSLLAYFLVAMLLVQSAPFAFADGATPSVTVADNTCTMGSNVTITVTGKDFENLGALPLEFYYDADVLTLNSATIGSSFQTYFSAINDEEPGKIIVNLAYEEPISVSNATLVSLSFKVADDAAAGSTEIAVAVGDARDGDLNAMTVSSTSGMLTIKEKTTVASTFRLYGSASPSALSKGDTVKLQVYNWNWLSLAGGKFRVSFDDALFRVKSAAFDSGVLQGEYLTEINDDVAGQVTLSYISDTAASTWPLFTVDLEVIGDVDTTAALTYAVIEAYDDNNVAYQTYSESTQVTLVKLPEVVDYPNFSVSSTEFVVGQQATSTLTLEASDVAAADFSLHFDPEVLEVVSVENISTATDANAHVMVDETTWDSGVINFSYMNIAGTVQDLPLLKITWNVLSAKAETELTLSGTGVKDVNIKDVTLEYVGETASVRKQQVAKPNADTTVFTYNGKAQTYTVAASTLYEVSNETQTSAGNYTVIVALKDKSNYEWADGTTAELNFTFTIGRKAVTVSADTKTKVYGHVDPALTYTVTGLVEDDTLNGVLSRTAGADVGTYAITQGTVSNGNNPNYAIMFAGANFTITRANQAIFSITGKPTGTITYGDSFTLGTSGGSGSGAVTWVVSKGSEYASVDNSGKVTTKGVGDVVITATKAESKNYKAISSTYAFTVKAAAHVHTYDDNVDGTCNGCGVERQTVERRSVVHMFRMYNPWTGEHFYTGSEVERENLVAVGWKYEGIGFTFPANTGAPVYRLYEPDTGEHLYTMDEAEKNHLMANGWNYEGIAFNSAYDTEAVQYRLHNPYATVGAYHFTFSEVEKQNLLNAGWEYQGIGWYSCWG